MREAAYQDSEGRWHQVLLPDGAPDHEASAGVYVGPPSLSELDLPLDVEIRLHNQLFHRRLFKAADVRRRKRDVVAALMATLAVDAEKVAQVFDMAENGYNEGSNDHTADKEG